MRTEEIVAALDAKLYGNTSKNTELDSVYVGDFLSRVISKAPHDCVWLTIMNNINVAGVAVMADIPFIVLCEGVVPDQNLISKANEEQIVLASTKLSAFDACVALQRLRS